MTSSCPCSPGCGPPDSVAGNFTAWLRQLVLLLGAHAGLIVLIGIVIGFPWAKHEPAPVILRRPVEPFGRQFVFFFATAPALLATVAGVVVGAPGPVGGIAPLVVLSGLAVVIAAGDAIALSHQRGVIATWFGLLLIPPALTVLALLTFPWFGIDLAVNQPAGPMAQFFADSFARRVGKDLPIVAGDPRTAALIGLGAPSRPSLFLAATPARSPWVSMRDIRAKGAIVVWPTTDTSGTPPAAIQAGFPRPGARGSARIRAHRARPLAAPAHRLGLDPTAVAAGRAAAGDQSRAIIPRWTSRRRAGSRARGGLSWRPDPIGRGTR